MSSISKVAVAGATGKIGPEIVKQLLAEGFQVTALTRGSNSQALPSTVVVKTVDYSSLESLTDALKGHDAVVSLLQPTAVDTAQRVLLDAAVKAQVKRFLPSEYGSNGSNEKVSQLPFFVPKARFQEAVRIEAAAGNLEYTLICTGPFLDMCLDLGLFMNLKERSTILYDGGNRLFSTTTVSTLAKAVAGVLKHPEQTKNRVVLVQDIAITQKRLVEMGEKATGPDGWKEEEVPVAKLLEEIEEEKKKSVPSHLVFVLNSIKIGVYGEGYGSHFQNLDNELLGIKGLTDAEVQSLVNTYAQKG
ncbi:nmrA-like family protein-like protein [Biscogniauxia marginata]|nr:nmrA-like family protein-like protein [Biscogniauxia marginata]